MLSGPAVIAVHTHRQTHTQTDAHTGSHKPHNNVAVILEFGFANEMPFEN